jgi:hypothetical protein
VVGNWGRVYLLNDVAAKEMKREGPISLSCHGVRTAIGGVAFSCSSDGAIASLILRTAGRNKLANQIAGAALCNHTLLLSFLQGSKKPFHEIHVWIHIWIQFHIHRRGKRAAVCAEEP